MAELVDAEASNAFACKGVRVRVPLRARKTGSVEDTTVSPLGGRVVGLSGGRVVGRLINIGLI